MRTTLLLDEHLIKELIVLTGSKTKTEAIHLAVSELIHSKKHNGLEPLSGKDALVENWQALEEVELEEEARQERGHRGHR